MNAIITPVYGQIYLYFSYQQHLQTQKITDMRLLFYQSLSQEKKTGFGFMNIVIKMLHQPCWFAIAVEKHIIVPVNFALFSSSSFLPTGCVWCVHLWNVCCVHTQRRYVCQHICNAHQPQVHTQTLCVHCVVCIFIFSKMQEVPQTEEYLTATACK